MQYRLLCVDLDGTLLDDHKQLLQENAEAVCKAWQMGMEICIASGRGAGSAAGYLRQMKVDGNVVALNGGQVLCHGQEIYRAVMDQTAAVPVLEMAEEMNVRCYFNDGEKTIAINETEEEIWQRLAGDKQLLASYEAETAEGLKKRLESGQVQVVKISLREDDPKRLEEIREKMMGRVYAQVAKSDENYLDVYPSGQSKWTGIEKLLAHLRFPAESCVCFGDNENDREMLKQAGLGIAMGNAAKELRDEARYVTRGNNDCGVAYGLYHWVIQEKSK